METIGAISSAREYTPDVPRALTVSELTRLLRDTVRGNPLLSRVLVRGETSNVQRAPSNLVFFTLKDANAQIGCVLFREEAEALGFDLEDGMDVVASGDVDLFQRKGDVQLVVRALTPAGIGAFWASFQRTRKKLEAEGLLDAARKRPLPRFPRRIGVVTSERGAVLHDILTILRRRDPLADVVVASALVQGPEAAVSLRRALEDVGPRVDVVILARGGGSLEDLWAFNDEGLARSIAACSVPVVSAVGHETDVTIADFVADMRAATPSAAAELVSPNLLEVTSDVQRFRKRIVEAIRDRLREAAESLAAVGERLTPRGLRRDVDANRVRLGAAARSLLQSGRRDLTRQRERLEALGRRLDVLSPLATLGRGYAIVSRPEGSVIPWACELTRGDPILVRLQDGRIHAHVDRTEVA